MSKHAKYGGSTAERTMNCNAWHSLSAGMPKSPTSYVAALGTALHTVIERCLLDTEFDPYDAVGEKFTIEGHRIIMDETLITEKIYPALDEFDNLMDKYSVDRIWVEQWVEVSEDVAGTADFIGLSGDGKTIVFADYKSGDGHIVQAEENSQALFYAMCAQHKAFKLHMLGVEKIVVAIVQPSFRREEYLDIWETTPERLRQFTLQHEISVEFAEEAKIGPEVGSWCSYCPAEATCPAKKKEVAKIDLIPFNTTLPTELSDALEIADKVESWIKAVRKTAQELLEQGVDIEGFKLVKKRATRQWADVPAAEKKVRLAKKVKIAEAYDMKLKSPAQLEKVCLGLGMDWDKFSKGLIESVSSGTTMVSVHDKREAVVISSASKLLAERFAQ